MDDDEFQARRKTSSLASPDEVQAERDFLERMDAEMARMEEPNETESSETRDALARLVNSMVAERKALRAAGKWSEADEIRDKLTAAGVEITDTKGHTTWRLK